MYLILLCFGTLFGLGAFFLLAGLLRLPTSASTKAVLTVTSRGKSQKGSINALEYFGSEQYYSDKFQDEAYDCRYCLYRKGKLKGCVYPDGCCCPVPQKPARRNGIEQVYEAATDSTAPVSECEGCPYGKAAPCIGWCTKEVMRAAGLPKERDRSHDVQPSQRPQDSAEQKRAGGGRLRQRQDEVFH